jgi:hypothetical protein
MYIITKWTASFKHDIFDMHILNLPFSTAHKITWSKVVQNLWFMCWPTWIQFFTLSLCQPCITSCSNKWSWCQYQRYIIIFMASTLESNIWNSRNAYGIFLHTNTVRTLVHREFSLITKNTRSFPRSHWLSATHPGSCRDVFFRISSSHHRPSVSRWRSPKACSRNHRSSTSSSQWRPQAPSLPPPYSR